MRGYAAHVRLYLGPHLGEVLLAELTTGHVQAMVAAIIQQHQALGTPVSAGHLDPDPGHPAGGVEGGDPPPANR